MRRQFFEIKLYRYLPFLPLILLLILGAGGTAVALRWHQVAKSGEIPVFSEEASYQPESGLSMGDCFEAVLSFRVPWNDSPKMATVNPGGLLQLTEDPYFERSGIHWGYCDWVLHIPLQGFRSGEGGGGSVNAEFFGGTLLRADLPTVAISDFVLPLDDLGEELSLAPPIERKRLDRMTKIITLMISMGIPVLLGLRLLSKRRKRRQAAAHPAVWEQALNEIRTLTDRVHHQECSTETAVAALTDIVRHYLEKRFCLRAEHQTTPEFLAELERDESLMKEKDRNFLSSFLAAADMVKFAKLPADKELYEQTSGRAKELISGTIPVKQDREITQQAGGERS